MPLQIVRDDITKIRADAIVNATNELLLPGGLGVDAAIHKAAGPALSAGLAGKSCRTGEVLVTPAYEISQCRYIIHAVPPVFSDGSRGERRLLERCYRIALDTADMLGCESIAFPLLASGANGYPRPEAYAIATSVIREFFISTESDLMVYLVLFGSDALGISRRAGDETELHIDDGYVTMKKLSLMDSLGLRRGGRPRGSFDGLSSLESCLPEPERYSMSEGAGHGFRREESCELCPTAARQKDYAVSAPAQQSSRKDRKNAKPVQAAKAPTLKAESLSAAFTGRDAEDFRAQDLSFGEMCDWWMDVKGIKIGEFYSASNLSRATYSNIKKKSGAIPKLSSALACVIGLRLDREQADDLLKRAGLALTMYNPIMRIVISYIERGNYDIDEINGVLYDSDLVELGTTVREDKDG